MNAHQLKLKTWLDSYLSSHRSVPDQSVFTMAAPLGLSKREVQDVIKSLGLEHTIITAQHWAYTRKQVTTEVIKAAT